MTDILKPAGENVKLAVLHYTKDSLAQDTTNRLKKNLSPGVEVNAPAAPSFSAMYNAIDGLQPDDFHVLLLLAHGRFYDEQNEFKLQDQRLVNVGELLVLLQDKVEGKMLLFGVCHLGGDDLVEAACRQKLAAVCIAPKSDQTITDRDIIQGYGSIVNQMQKLAYMDVTVEQLPHLVGGLSDELRNKLQIYPEP